jgi:hypothetical protein
MLGAIDNTMAYLLYSALAYIQLADDLRCNRDGGRGKYTFTYPSSPRPEMTVCIGYRLLSFGFNTGYWGYPTGSFERNEIVEM